MQIEHSGAWRKNTHAQHLFHPIQSLAQLCIRFAYDYDNTLCELQFKYLSFPLGDNGARSLFFPPSTFFVRIRRDLIRAFATAIGRMLRSTQKNESEDEMHQKLE